MDILLVIDMQDALFFGEIERFDAQGVICRINRLSEAVRAHGGRVIHIQHDGPEADGLFLRVPAGNSYPLSIFRPPTAD